MELHLFSKDGAGQLESGDILLLMSYFLVGNRQRVKFWQINGVEIPLESFLSRFVRYHFLKGGLGVGCLEGRRGCGILGSLFPVNISMIGKVDKMVGLFFEA